MILSSKVTGSQRLGRGSGPAYDGGMNREAWLNGRAPMTSVWGITAYLSSEVYTVQVNNGANGFGLAQYSTAAAVNGAVAALTEDQGYPWVAVGDAANMVDNDNVVENYVLAVNLASSALTSLAAGSGGLLVNGTPTPGSAPWGTPAQALAGVLALVGNYTWPS